MSEETAQRTIGPVQLVAIGFGPDARFEGRMADRGATRTQTRQMYRTASRTQRRRTFVESRMGPRQDFAPAEEPGAGAAAAAPAAEQPAYLAELEQLSRLREQDVISPEEFDAKKRQLLGI